MDWHSLESQWMLPPKMSAVDRALTNSAKKRAGWVRGHIWIASSGTTRAEGVRWVGIGKAAFLASANAVNEHLQASQRDVWLAILPNFHVGGLSIFARAHLSRSRVIDRSHQKWNAKSCLQDLEKFKVTLVSMVPTQIFDLVKAKLRPPKSLRAVIVGGGALDETLYFQGRELGWPLLPSYGLTECCSQVATADLNSLTESAAPKLQILSHVEMKTIGERLAVRSPALATYSLSVHPERGFTLETTTRNGWLVTEDLGALDGKFVKVFGRGFERVKVLGELISLQRIEEELRLHGLADVCVFALPDDRKGHALNAVIESPKSLRSCREAIATYHRHSPSLWRLESWYAVDEFPRSALGKVQKAKLQALLGLNSLT